VPSCDQGGGINALINGRQDSLTRDQSRLALMLFNNLFPCRLSWPPSGAREFPTVAPSPALHNSGILYWRYLLRRAIRIPTSEYVGDPQTDAGSTSRAVAHRKAAISRAIAVITTVLRLPFAMRR
jgi:hypothetical protein